MTSTEEAVGSTRRGQKEAAAAAPSRDTVGGEDTIGRRWWLTVAVCLCRQLSVSLCRCLRVCLCLCLCLSISIICADRPLLSVTNTDNSYIENHAKIDRQWQKRRDTDTTIETHAETHRHKET